MSEKRFNNKHPDAKQFWEEFRVLSDAFYTKLDEIKAKYDLSKISEASKLEDEMRPFRKAYYAETAKLQEKYNYLYTEIGENTTLESTKNMSMAKFDELTKYIDILELDKYGDWIVDHQHKGTEDDPIQMPFVAYTEAVHKFIHAVYDFGKSHPEYEHTKYVTTLEANGIEWGSNSMSKASVSSLDAKAIIALLIGALRADRFCEGALLDFLNDGSIRRWLSRLKELDEMQ